MAQLIGDEQDLLSVDISTTSSLRKVEAATEV